MFLRIVDVYLIFNHSRWKPKPSGIKIIDLEATSVEKKIYINIANFYHLWIEHSGVTHGPYYPQRKQNQQGNDEQG